jgi:hypothetical protein
LGGFVCYGKFLFLSLDSVPGGSGGEEEFKAGCDLAACKRFWLTFADLLAPQVLSLAQQIVVMLDLPTSLAKKPDLQAAVLESVGKVCLRETNIHDRLKTDDGCR